MKRILMLCVLLVGTLQTVTAQIATPLPRFAPPGRFSISNNPYFTTKDTVTNATADTFAVTVAGLFNGLTFQTNVTKISGTPYGNTIQLQACADGSGLNYATLYTDSVKNSPTNQTFIHSIQGNPNTSYRVIVTGIASQSCSYQNSLLFR